jgi:hypothetical protein
MCSFEPSKLGSKHDENSYRRGARNGRAAASISENCDHTLVVFLMFSTRIHVRTSFESRKLTRHRVASAVAVTPLWVRVGRW